MLESDRNKDGELTRDAKGRLENLELLVQDATGFIAPPPIFSPIERMTAWLDRIALTADADDIPEGGEVTLMTVHASKGLEFPVVFVVQMNEDVFPHQRSAETGLEEERRLAYVAFTRAMKRLVVTRSLHHPKIGLGNGRVAKASRFLYGIPLDVVDGDLPAGDPASGGRGERLQEARETTTRIRTFLEHRRKRQEKAAEAPEHQYTLVEIEDADQLSRGVRVHHPRYGIGEITQVQPRAIYVNFDGRHQRITAPAPDLRIVAE